LFERRCNKLLSCAKISSFEANKNLKGARLKEKLVLLLIIAIIAPTAEYLILPTYTSSATAVAITKIYGTTLQTGQTIRVNVTVSDVSDAVSCGVSLRFDPSVLKVTTGDKHGFTDPFSGIKYDIYQGPFFKSFSSLTTFNINEVDNAAGNITFLLVAINQAGVLASGSGVIASINFTCTHSTSDTTINITGPYQGHSLLQTSLGGVGTSSLIGHKDVDGFITAGGGPGVWTQLWFQATLVVLIVEVMIVALGILITVRWWRSEGRAEREDRAVLEDLVR
jgi:hypothetical protein